MTLHPASDLRPGQTVQHFRRYWPAQQITAIRPFGAFRDSAGLRVSLSGGSAFTVSHAELDRPLFIITQGNPS